MERSYVVAAITALAIAAVLLPAAHRAHAWDCGASRCVHKDCSGGVNPASFLDTQQYISDVYKRWQQQAGGEQPARRELNYRRGERMLGKAMAAKSYTAAAAIYTAMTKQSAATSVPPSRWYRNAIMALGAPPTDPGEALGHARQILLIEMAEVATNPGVDQERRRRWLSEFAGKLGMLYSRAEAEGLLRELERDDIRLQDPGHLPTIHRTVEHPHRIVRVASRPEAVRADAPACHQPNPSRPPAGGRVMSARAHDGSF